MFYRIKESDTIASICDFYKISKFHLIACNQKTKFENGKILKIPKVNFIVVEECNSNVDCTITKAEVFKFIGYKFKKNNA